MQLLSAFNKKAVLVTRLLPAGLVLGLMGCQTVAPSLTSPSSRAQAHAIIASTATQAQMGEIMLRPVSGGVQVYGKVTGLEPNSIHAIHIHEGNSCADVGKAAGGHLNPNGHNHGRPDDINSHFGDMPNITADANGVARVNFINTKLSLTPDAINSAYNHTVIIHTASDDYSSQPSGNAGGRIACGIISK